MGGWWGEGEGIALSERGLHPAPPLFFFVFARICFITDFYRHGAESGTSSTLKRASSRPLPPPGAAAARNRHRTVEISSVKCFVSPRRACGETQRSALVSALLRLTFSQKPSTLEGGAEGEEGGREKEKRLQLQLSQETQPLARL